MGELRRIRSGSLEEVQARIANAVLDRSGNVAVLGCIRLEPHQVSAVERLRRAIREFGGALLCDPVGTGKTFTALAVAPDAGHNLVIAPAVLRPMWMCAARNTGREISFVSVEALSHGRRLQAKADFLIIDEAHHFRNISTLRYDAVSEIAGAIPTLMLTATPVHNRRADLRRLLSLLLGQLAETLSEAELSRCVVRRDNLELSLQLPRTTPIVWHELHPSDEIPQLLLALPPPLPASDGEDGLTLVVHSLVRQWASSDAALIGALRRRLAQSTALISALNDGTWPTKRELISWIGGDATVQLSFAGILASPTSDAHALLRVVESHRDAVAYVLDRVRKTAVNDANRAEAIDSIRNSDAPARMVAFTSYADTAKAMFSLIDRTGAAVLASSGARVAGGRISRREALDRFAPVASGTSRRARPAEDITFLLTTDLLSEGVNLQDASVVIHLDLPWTPARIAQRLGRLARIGSTHETVISHAFRPPASAEMIIHVESILERKAVEAHGEQHSSEIAERIRSTLASWRRAADEGLAPVAVSVLSATSGFLAAVRNTDGVRLVACHDGQISDAPLDVLHRLTGFSGIVTSSSQGDTQVHIDNLDNWLRCSAALEHVAGGNGGRRTVRARILDEIAFAVSTARHHDRANVSRLASRARLALGARLSHHTERLLVKQLESKNSGIPWLESLNDLLAVIPREKPHARWELIAMIVFCREMRCSAEENAVVVETATG
jgi:superfamily II DNA or RNA helicase